VAVEDKHAYWVLDGEREWLASVPGRMLHQASSRAELPKVGDWVALRLVAEAGKAVIERVLPRRTRLIRKTAGRDVDGQVLAANVDVAFVMAALDASFNPRRIERFLVMSREGGIRPVVVLNKADLCDTVAEQVAVMDPVAGGAPVLAVSARTGRGLRELRSLIPAGQTAVLVGSSGVGKSSLINGLCGEEIQATVEVRESDARGRHTTTWRELIPLPGGGLVIDTPGMREFHMWLADEGLEESFPDLEALADGCRFRRCTHTTENHCAVRQAVEQGAVSRERYTNYLKLKHELEYLAEERKRHTFHARRAVRAGKPRRYERDRGWSDGE
jgi:ribosome biogenesis GTPase